MLYRKITSYIEDHLKSETDKILILEGALVLSMKVLWLMNYVPMAISSSTTTTVSKARSIIW